MNDISTWFFLNVAPWVSGFVVMFYVWARWFQPAPRDGYSEWVAEIERHNPGWQKPWLSNGERNPLWKPGQTIVHEDGTTYTFDDKETP